MFDRAILPLSGLLLGLSAATATAQQPLMLLEVVPGASEAPVRPNQPAPHRGDFGVIGLGMAGNPMGMGMLGGLPALMLILMDTDGDGALSLDEFLAVHERIYGALDANKDGLLTADEMRGPMLGVATGPAVPGSSSDLGGGWANAGVVDTGCTGGITGGGNGVSVLENNQILRWSQMTAAQDRVELDLGPNPELAAQVRDELDRVDFQNIAFDQPGNMTCFVVYDGNAVVWEVGNAQVPQEVLAVHEVLMAAGGER